MKTLFLIDGAAGSGKTDLIEYVNHKFGAGQFACIVPKFTTRPRRKEESERNLELDLMHVSKDVFSEHAKSTLFLSYEYGDSRFGLYHYGFYIGDVKKALDESPNVFLIVRNRPLIQRLQDLFAHIKVIPVFIYSDEFEIGKRMKAEGYSKNAIMRRKRRLRVVWNDYKNHPEIYERVLINNASKNDFHHLLEQMLFSYSFDDDSLLYISEKDKFQLVRPLPAFRKEMERRLAKYPYPRNVFLMMKYRSSNEAVGVYIAENLEKHGFNCVTAQMDDWQITGDTYNPVAVLYCCKYGIVLFDEPEKDAAYNPNVAYELGMMHLQSKKCLILKHKALPNVPFDLVSRVYKEYSKDLELKDMISSWIAEIAMD
ncbi:MAG: hypothetical protein FVQ79_03740 [Planctomycetes bacterium]|nr:hypothetical protein [Planctomycetota bacterium]